MALFTYVQKLANLDFNLKTDSLTDLASSFLSKDTTADVLKTKLPTDLSFISPELAVTTTKITDTTKATTPVAGKPLSNGDELESDAYRYGNNGASTAADNLANPRTIGERADDRKDLAAISLSINTGAPGAGVFDVTAYSRFFLQSVVEGEQEKFQVVETFSNYYAFFFGKRPPFYKFSGILLNDQNHSWSNDFKFYYENFFRGTRSTELAGTVTIKYDGRHVTGFLVGLQMQQVAELDKGIPFSVDVLVVDHTPDRFSADISSLVARRKEELKKLSTAIQEFIAQSNKGARSTVLDAAKKFAYNKRKGNKQMIAKNGKTDTKKKPPTAVAKQNSKYLVLPEADRRTAGTKKT